MKWPLSRNRTGGKENHDYYLKTSSFEQQTGDTSRGGSM
jgi:hypothetical protein